MTDELLSRPLSLVVALALVSFLPILFVATTSFVKTTTVLHITRSALGTQGIPSNTVVLALSASLTLLAMAPVGSKILARLDPVLEAKNADAVVLVRGVVGAASDPLRAFLKANAGVREKARFLALAKKARGADAGAVSADDLPVLVPAFMTTELYEAFALGFLIFLPFLVLDLVVANVLAALGLTTTSPTHVSLPLKLLLFVAVDGWGLLAQSLVSGYRPG